MSALKLIIVGFCVVAVATPAAEMGGAGRYETAGEFLGTVFPDGVPASSTLWVQGDLRQAIESCLNHPFAFLRIRYWQAGDSSAWILDEIGKELPITIGVMVTGGAIHRVHILEFRESRGWEVRFPFFTDQFRHTRLGPGGNLDRQIDGITGATLSVRAVTRISRVALLLHEHVSQTD